MIKQNLSGKPVSGKPAHYRLNFFFRNNDKQGMGAIGWGFLSDVFGRKKALCGSALFVVVFGLCSSQVPNYWTMLLCRCLVGFGLGGYPQAVVILTEILPVQRRGTAIISLAFFWSAGTVTFLILALHAFL